ncbi:hypothetical protein [Neobacillus sp. DY30]|uniref:hypothetical protein n=1 Tax=Neobacillus sp. DY30 TaxID=3047871 RepID=UPI0024C0BB8A|nr:hypothetical protein [Neobacillus sp. DY30]WHY03305.1 hypothetical protein QNH29_14235 [Neobacillus sp. DY30]
MFVGIQKKDARYRSVVPGTFFKMTVRTIVTVHKEMKMFKTLNVVVNNQQE